MGLETGSTISSFITSNPTSSDPVNQGDDHLRLIKSVLQAQFPGSGGLGYATAITTTEAELNALHGFTNVGFAAGTVTNFFQAAAPTGWTQNTSYANHMMRVVSGTGGGSGGTASPILNNTVPAHTHGFSTGGASANHTHYDSGHAHAAFANNGYTASLASGIWGSLGTPGATGVAYAQIGWMSADHGHSGSTDNGSSQTNWTPKYIDNIICAKN